MYIAPVETIISPGYKLVYFIEMPQFLQAVGSNGLPQYTQFPYALASFSRLGKHCCYVAFRKTHCLPKLLPVQIVVFDFRSRKSCLSARVFASTPMLSVLLGAGSGVCALRGTPATGLVNAAILHRRHFALGRSTTSPLPSSAECSSEDPYGPVALAPGNSRDPLLSLMRNLPSFTGHVRACDGLDGAGNSWDVDKGHTNTQYLLR